MPVPPPPTPTPLPSDQDDDSWRDGIDLDPLDPPATRPPAATGAPAGRHAAAPGGDRGRSERRQASTPAAPAASAPGAPTSAQPVAQPATAPGSDRGRSERQQAPARTASRSGRSPAPVGADTPAIVLPGLGRRPPRQRDGTTRILQRSSASLPISSFDDDASVDPTQPRTSRWVWLGLGVGWAALGQLAAWWFFHATDTFGGALMFTVAGLAGFIFPLFKRNAKEIWGGHLPPFTANRLLLADLHVLFAGLIAGYLAMPLLMGLPRYAEIFAGIARFVDVRRASLADVDFSGVGWILLTNLRVALVFFLIGLLVRYVGILIVVVWNAATWGIVFAAALAGGLGGAAAGGWQGGQLAIIVLPHLIAETAGYLCAAMAGIFLSRAVFRYRWLGERFAAVGAAVLVLLAQAGVLVLIAALLEGLWGRWLAGLWFQDGGVID